MVQAVRCILVAALCASGCVGDVPPLPDPDTTEAVAVHPGGKVRVDDPVNRKVSTNGLRLDSVALDGLRKAALAGEWTSGTTVAASPWVEALSSSILGAELIEYVARCALDQATVLTLTSGVRLPGQFGLAQQWTDAQCDDSCQRWVSACLLAHANAAGTEVPISLRGFHPGLSWDTQLERDFPLQEGAFYGNVFASGHELYACIGSGLGAIANPDSYLQQRLCGLSPICGLVQTGPCDMTALGGIGATDVDVGDACEDEAGSAGAYANCHVGPQAELAPRVSPVYEEVVTVYLIR